MGLLLTVTRREGVTEGDGNEGRKMGIIRVKACKRNQEVKGYADHFWAEARTFGGGKARAWACLETSRAGRSGKTHAAMLWKAGWPLRRPGRPGGSRSPFLPSAAMGVGKDGFGEAEARSWGRAGRSKQLPPTPHPNPALTAWSSWSPGR